MVYNLEGLRDREYDKFNFIGSETAVRVTVVSGIINIGSVSASVDNVTIQSGTLYVISGDNINITGMPKTEVYGSGTFNVLGSVNVNNQIYPGSEAWVKEVPLTEVYGSGTFITLGSVNVNNQVYAGSEAWVKEIPLTEVYGSGTFNVAISGALTIGSVSVEVDSVYIQSGNNVEVYGSGTFDILGSVNISNRIS